MWRAKAVGMWLAAGLLVSAVAEAASVQPEPDALRPKVAPAVCTVVAENAWGVPRALATGWLLGGGRFVVTDLSALKACRAERVTLTFADGTRATAREFGLADPGLGLCALRVEMMGAGRPGLPLAASLPALGSPVPVVTAGYAWGERFEMKAGRLLAGPQIQAVAARSGVTGPEGVDRFVRVEGETVRAASGAPILDTEGRVVAVRLDVATRGLTAVLAMPATTLRASLLSATPELKPLSDLPEPLWPVHLVRLPGQPTSQAVFTKASQTIFRGLICDRCRGKGRVDPSGYIFDRDVRCPECQGAGLRLTPEVYEALKTWALEGTRVVWSPLVDGRTRTAVRKAGVEMLARLATVGRHLRRTLPFLGLLNVVRPAARPEGILLYARVNRTLEGPDGSYLILEAFNTRTPVAVRADDLTGTGGLGPAPGRSVPKRGTWFALAGAVVSGFDTGAVRGVFVLPFEWAPYVPALDPSEVRDPRDARQRPWDGRVPWDARRGFDPGRR